MLKFENTFKNKTVLITGHTGFKGSWLSIWLHELGAKVVGYSLDPLTDRDNFVLSKIGEKIIDIRGDVRDKEKLDQVFNIYKPEFVFHLAAQPLVRLSYEKPFETYEINVMGTINVLEAIRDCDSVKVGIFVTTDKCYENIEQLYGYRESDPMGGYDPYSSSKAAMEIAISSWRRSYFNQDDYVNHRKSIASVRAGNVIGGGDWAKDRIIPDSIRSIEANKEIVLRNPQSIRPWEHVLEPLSGYLLLGEKMFNHPLEFGEAWNFGPELVSVINVNDIANKVINCYGKGKISIKETENRSHEAGILLLDINKARLKLQWKPTLGIDETIKLTVDWYKNYCSLNVYELCKDQIKYFSKLGGYSDGTD